MGRRGDSYDRFLIRIREMFESIYIIFQVIANLVGVFETEKMNVVDKTKSDKGFRANAQQEEFDFFNFLKQTFPDEFLRTGFQNKYTSMEAMIDHFKYYSEGFKVPKGFTYQAVESPKGEFGVALISDGSSIAYRCKIRSPAFYHLAMMPAQIQGHYFADMVTVLGSQDIVFGEVDR